MALTSESRIVTTQSKVQSLMNVRRMVIIFFLSLLIRGVVLLHASANPEVVIQSDSKMYVTLGQGLAQYNSLSSSESPSHLDAGRMPGYPFFLAIFFWLFGCNLVPVVAAQVLIDCLNCILVGNLSRLVWKGSELLAGLLSAASILLATYAHFILTDSLFVTAVLFLLLGCVKYLSSSSWKNAAGVGIWLGLAAWIRPVILYLPFVLVPFFIARLVFNENKNLLIATLRISLIPFLFVVLIAPWVARNYVHWGKVRLVAQSGEHLLQYVVPFVWQYSRGVPFVDGMKLVNLQFSEKMMADGVDLDRLDAFEKSDLHVKMALDILKGEPVSAVVKAWFFGLMKNLFSPAIIDLSYLLGIDRPHFFSTKGTTTMERGWNFIKGMKGWFGWVVVANIVVLILSRIVQLWGLVLMMKRKPWEAMFFVLIIGYFLIISGPVGYAKYRLPFEPVLIVLLAIGLKDLWERIRGQRSDVGGRKSAKAASGTA